MADGQAPPEPPKMGLSPSEYLFYSAGVRQGHADAVNSEGENMKRLADWFASGTATPEAVSEQTGAHASQAFEHAREARVDSQRLLDEAIAARPRRVAFFVRLRAAWRALLGS